MYDVKITNNYHLALITGGSGVQPIPPDPIPPKGGVQAYTGWGTIYVEVPGMGLINFLDLGDKKLPEFTNPAIPWTEATWGGLIRYRGIDAYFRYEGQGSVEVVVDAIGSVSLTFAQGGMIVNIPDMTAS
ncbi:MAG: hypothetical protein KDD67_18085 [Ignavibacteriae bacterium]|nr:hypothetical protein [Ignavibacteriota bacterium]MCB9214576.1 hypothetical protein [Ignavibacteria bacterium]